jgi:hypothetical protein
MVINFHPITAAARRARACCRRAGREEGAPSSTACGRVGASQTATSCATRPSRTSASPAGLPLCWKERGLRLKWRRCDSKLGHEAGRLAGSVLRYLSVPRPGAWVGGLARSRVEEEFVWESERDWMFCVALLCATNIGGCVPWSCVIRVVWPRALHRAARRSCAASWTYLL